MKRWRLDSSKNCADTPQYDPRWPNIESGTPWAFMAESTGEPCITEYPNDCDYVRWDDAERLAAERDALRARVALYEKDGAGVVPVSGGMCEEVYRDGEFVSLSTSEAGTLVQQLRASVAVLEAPPVVPEGWDITPKSSDGTPGWWITRSPEATVTPPAVLRALAWAREHNQRPTHAGDKP